MTEPKTPAEGTADSVVAVPPRGAETVAAERWRAAEDRLYPLIVADPDLYTLVVELVVEARDLLRTECMSVPALIETAAADVLARCAKTQVVQSEGFDPQTAFDAARAARLRELRQS
ncbi:hypothetical protein [Leekyejoonella antrihumi]|uniref:hypothetical protein n=1 Tax=Leekyejoonella antrihumi TaxID=1660198 RepID=UPI001648F1FF|nr:hypothetical protein [Leekyejoonella antrihumi]